MKTLLLMLLITAGCDDDPAALSSGHVGCAPADIVVANYEMGKSGSPATWKATCGGRAYFCTHEIRATHCAMERLEEPGQ